MKVKRILCLVIALMLSTTAMFGCGRRDEDEQPDVNPEMSQLYVGLGTNGINGWMAHAKAEFEAKFADVSFEEGKKGVQIYFKYDEKFANWDTLPVNYTNYQEKLIITENIPYKTVKSIGLDITNTVTSPISQGIVSGTKPGEESTSIADKMDESFREYYNYDGNYYGIPAQICPQNMIYDVDLFDEYGLYFANETTENCYEYEIRTNAYTKKSGTYRFVDGEWTKADLSNGPDGKPGTYDDGMPATYEEFFALLEYMERDCGLDPFRWAGKVPSYFMGVISGLAIDYEGEDYYKSINFNGTDNELVKFDSNGKIVLKADGTPEFYSAAITEENGYQIVDQVGYYYALQFMDALLGSSYYDKDVCFSGIEDHLATQIKYLDSRRNTQVVPIGILCEGSWWIGEASATFTNMAEKYGEEWSMQNRNFAFMPLPKVDEAHVGTKQYTENSLEMVTFVTKDINDTQKKLADTFIKYMYSDKALYDFAKITGQMRPYNFSMTDEQYDALPGFARSNYNIMKNTEVVLKASHNNFFNTNNGLFTSVWSIHWQSEDGDNPVDLAHHMGKSGTQIFEGVHAKWNKTYWDSFVSK